MNLKLFAQVIQLILSLLLIVLVLLQSRGTGLSSAFSGIAGAYRTKRGVDRVIFILTILCGILFFFNSLAILLLQ